MNETAIAIRPEEEIVVSRGGFNPLTGTLQEKILACDQIAANIAQLALNGWDNVPKCKAGFWLADGANIHPAIFMQKHHCMIIKGKLIVEPMWEFIVGVLKSRLPGFRWRVEEETEEIARVWMAQYSKGGELVEEHRVEYTIADARRQKLLDRDNAWAGGNTKEMLLKQAIKRAGKRIGAAVLLDLALPDFDDIPEQHAALPDATGAIDKALEPAAAAPVETAAAPAAKNGRAKEPKPPVKVLSDRLVKFYGTKMTAAVALEKASIVYNELQKKQTGVDPGVRFRRPDDIGPAEALQIVEYLDELDAKRGGGQATEAGGERDATEAVEGRTDEATRPREPGDDEEPEGDPDSPPEAERVESTAHSAPFGWNDFKAAIERARKLFTGRKFLAEAPAGSGTWWYVDQETYETLGYKSAPKIIKNGLHPGDAGADQFIIDLSALERLGRALNDYCDTAERSR